MAQSGQGSWLTHLFGKGENPPEGPPPGTAAGPSRASNEARGKAVPGAKPEEEPSAQPSEEQEKKKGLLDRIFGIFGGSKQPADKSKPQQ